MNHPSRISSTGNRFAPLQDDEVIPEAALSPVDSKGDKDTIAAADQAVANHMVGPGWTPAPSCSKDSAATLAASRARLLGVKIIKKRD